MNVFTYLQHLIETDDQRALYLIGLIAIAMVIDFLTGSAAAWYSPAIDFKSKAGINGILRKISSLIMLVFFIPVSVLLPSGTGVAVLFVTYFGYLIMELTSILENLKKLGVNIGPFDLFLGRLKSNAPADGDKQDK